MSARTACAIAALTGALLVAGCAGGDDAVDPDTGESAVTVDTTSSDDASGGGDTAAVADDAPGYEGFDDAFASVLALEEAAAYGDAIREGMELRSEASLSTKQKATIDAALQRIRVTRREAPALRHAIDQLASNKDAEVAAARRQLLDAGDVGLRMLRHAVREADAKGAAAALKILVQQRDAEAASALLARLEDASDVEASRAMLATLGTASDTIPLDVLPRMRAFAKTTNGWPHADRIQAMVDARLAVPVERDEIAPLVDAIKRDVTFKQLGVADVLITLYHNQFARNDDAFAEVAGDSALPVLRAYAARAAESSDPAAVRWGGTASTALVKLDFTTLKKGLVARWTFEDISDNVVACAVEGGPSLSIVKPEEELIVDGRAGSAIRLWGRSDYAQTAADDVALRTVHHGSYTFAAWIRARQLPPGRAPDEVSMIIGRPGDGWDIGVALTRRGNVLVTHYLKDHDSVGAVSRAAVEVGQWHHVAGVVDRDKGLVRVFVDGALEGEQTFAPGAGADTAQDAFPIRLSRADAAISKFSQRYRGDIDDACVYSRALTSAEVAALMASIERE